MNHPAHEQPSRAAYEQRKKLADDYQGQALEHGDPGKANLQFLAGDLLRLAAALSTAAGPTDNPPDQAALERHTDRTLRLARQFTYMHRLVTHTPLAPASPPRAP